MIGTNDVNGQFSEFQQISAVLFPHTFCLRQICKRIQPQTAMECCVINLSVIIFILKEKRSRARSMTGCQLCVDHKIPLNDRFVIRVQPCHADAVIDLTSVSQSFRIASFYRRQVFKRTIDIRVGVFLNCFCRSCMVKMAM